jgi:hypothetical protein
MSSNPSSSSALILSRVVAISFLEGFGLEDETCHATTKDWALLDPPLVAC